MLTLNSPGIQLTTRADHCHQPMFVSCWSTHFGRNTSLILSKWTVCLTRRQFLEEMFRILWREKTEPWGAQTFQHPHIPVESASHGWCLGGQLFDKFLDSWDFLLQKTSTDFQDFHCRELLFNPSGIQEWKITKQTREAGECVTMNKHWALDASTLGPPGL